MLTAVEYAIKAVGEDAEYTLAKGQVSTDVRSNCHKAAMDKGWEDLKSFQVREQVDTQMTAIGTLLSNQINRDRYHDTFNSRMA